jgi:hypothetical protein
MALSAARGLFTHPWVSGNGSEESLMSRSIARCLVLVATAILTSPAAALTVSIGTSFTGSTLQQVTAPDPLGLPPDTMGAVGDAHVVELLNGRFAVYDKSSGQLLQSDTLTGFWTNAGAPPKEDFALDPRVLYDATSRRWFAASVDGLTATGDFLLAVSDSADPTQGWTAFTIDTDPTDQSFAEFPTLGINSEGVYLAAERVSLTTFQAVGTTVAVVPKADLLAPAPTVGNATVLTQGAAVTGFGPQPAVDLDGSGLPEPMLSGNFAPFGILNASRIGGTIDTPVIEAATVIPAPAVTFTPDAPQPGPKLDLETGGNNNVTFFGASVVLQEGALWAVQGVGVSGRNAIRWFQIDPDTNIILQSGLIEDEELDLYYPSIAVNDLEQVVIGFSGSSESQFVSAYAVVGETLVGSTTFGTPILLKEGVSDYERLDTGGRNRWGDYSATVLDPNDPRSFWTFQAFVFDTDVWGIQVTEIRVPEPATALLLACGLVGLAVRKRLQ